VTSLRDFAVEVGASYFTPAKGMGNVLKRVVNVCQRAFVNEVLGPLVTEFVWPRERETDSARFPRRPSRSHVGGQTCQT